MAESPLAKKMKLKPGSRAAVVGAPEGYLEQLGPLPEGVEVSSRLQGPFDWIQLFAKTRADLEKRVPAAVRALGPDGLLWIGFPKGTSKLQTDLTRDTGWEVLRDLDLKWVTLISVDATWSAFALRRYRAGEPRQSFR